MQVWPVRSCGVHLSLSKRINIFKISNFFHLQVATAFSFFHDKRHNDFWSKTCIFFSLFLPVPVSCEAFIRGVPLCAEAQNLVSKNWSLWATRWGNRMILSLLVLSQYQHLTDRQTDRHAAYSLVAHVLNRCVTKTGTAWNQDGALVVNGYSSIILPKHCVTAGIVSRLSEKNW